MLFRNVGAFANLALVARAVLIPPTFTAEELGDDFAMETLAVNPFKRTVSLDCPGCAIASQDGNSLVWAQNQGNSFLLDFEVGAREDTLNIDGVQIYPPTLDFFGTSFYVTQVDPNSKVPIRLRVTAYSLVHYNAETITEAGTELIPMTFRISSIESEPVEPPALTINLLKDVNGRLMMASFQTAKAGEASPIDEEKDCQQWPLLCKWKNILSDKINGMKTSGRKGCHKHKGNPMEQDTPHGKPPHRFRPHHGPHHNAEGHRGHHHGHHHHEHHRFHMFVRQAFFTVIIPILLGIFAGTVAYLIGMTLGCLIAVVVAKARGRSAYETIAQDDDEDMDEGDEKIEKVEYAELPVYEAPPVYEEAAEKEVVAETQ